jgi:hypothetical protein
VISISIDTAKADHFGFMVNPDNQMLQEILKGAGYLQ